MAARHELEADAAARRGVSTKLLQRSADHELRSAYRRLFLGRDGKLTRNAELVLGDLARLAGLGKVSPDAPDSFLQFREGKRAIVLHAFAKMDPDTLATLTDKMREEKP